MADEALDDEALLEELEEALTQERQTQEAIKAAAAATTITTTTTTITPPRQTALSSANTPNTPNTPLSSASSGRSTIRQSSLLPPGSILRRNSGPVSADSPNSTLKHEPQTQAQNHTQNQTQNHTQNQNQSQTQHITSPNIRGTPSVPTKTAVSSAASKGPKSTPPAQPIIATAATAAAAAKTGVRPRPASGQNSAASSMATATQASSSSLSATGIGRARLDSNGTADLSAGNGGGAAQTPLLGRTRSVDGNRLGLPSQAVGTPGASSALKRASSKSVVVPASQPVSTRTTLRSPVTTSRAADSQNMVAWVQRNLGGIDDDILHDAGLHSLGSNDGNKSNGNSTELVKCLTHIALKLNEKCMNSASENGRIIEENEYLRRRIELMTAETQNQQEMHEEMIKNMRSEIESISRRVNHELTLFRQEMELQEANSSRARRALQQKLDEAEEKVIQLKKENEATSRANP